VTPPPARGACAVVDPKATSAQVLGQVGGVREERGLICAVDSFPAAGCGDQVKDADVPDVPSPEPTIQLQLAQPPPATTEPTDDSATSSASPSPAQDGSTNADSASEGGGFPVWPVVVVVIIVLLAAGAFWQVRRRNASAAGSSDSAGD
jgi:hypothetical protein